MYLYLVRHYILTTIGVAAFMTLGALWSGRIELDTTLRQALFWGPIVAALVVYREFTSRGIWPLYDNLRISRVRPLALLASSTLVIAQLLLLWVL